MDELGYYDITVKRSNGEEMKVKMWEEATVSDWIPVFKSILNWATYHPDNIDDMFSKEAE